MQYATVRLAGNFWGLENKFHVPDVNTVVVSSELLDFEIINLYLLVCGLAELPQVSGAPTNYC